MANNSENILQKAFYLGVGMAGLAVEKATDTLQELKKQTEAIASYPDFPQKLQQIADGMVAKGKMSTEEARKYVDEILLQQQSSTTSVVNESTTTTSSPRTIDIVVDDDE